jgi:hypothetical protein
VVAVESATWEVLLQVGWADWNAGEAEVVTDDYTQSWLEVVAEELVVVDNH